MADKHASNAHERTVDPRFTPEAIRALPALVTEDHLQQIEIALEKIGTAARTGFVLLSGSGDTSIKRFIGPRAKKSLADVINIFTDAEQSLEDIKKFIDSANIRALEVGGLAAPGAYDELQRSLLRPRPGRAR